MRNFTKNKEMVRRKKKKERRKENQEKYIK
jgi:hypothetical protein